MSPITSDWEAIPRQKAALSEWDLDLNRVPISFKVQLKVQDMTH